MLSLYCFCFQISEILFESLTQFMLQVQLILIVGVYNPREDSMNMSERTLFSVSKVAGMLLQFSYIVYGYFSFRVYMANRSITPDTPIYTPDHTPDQDEEEAESML